MNITTKSGRIRQRLSKESKGSFSAVHKALKETRRRTKTDSLDVEEVVKVIKRNMRTAKSKKVS